MILKLTITHFGNRDLQSMVAKVKGPQSRQRLNYAMITEVQHLTVEHLRAYSAGDSTAARLGAAPSNYWAQGAEKVAAPSSIGADTDHGTLTINHPGIGRAFHDLTIRAVKAQALTIPLVAAAYNRRAPEIRGLTIVRAHGKAYLFLPDAGSAENYKKRHYTGRTGKDGRDEYTEYHEPGARSGIFMYLLVRSVTQRQDRSLLPSDEEFEQAAALGARRFLFSDIKNAGGKF